MSNDMERSDSNNLKSNSEPSELDPCMKDSKNKRESNFFREYSDKISEKTGLSNKGVYIVGGIIVFAIILLIIVIALASAFPKIPHEHQYPICMRPECLRTSAEIRESLVSTVSPCDDLWTAMCGGWLNKYPIPKDRSLWNQKQLLVRREAESVRDLIATIKLPLHFHTVEWKLKNFYDACMNVDNVNNERALTLTKYISELGGWYILEDWTEMAFDKNELLQKLQVKYGVSPYFRILVEPHPNMPGHHVLVISPSGLGLPDREYYYLGGEDRIQMAYKEYIRDVLIYLGAPRTEATKFATDMFSYEKRIAEITPSRYQLQNPITTYNALSLSELKQTNLIPLFDILQAMYPESNITENTEVIITSVDYLEQIAQIIATTDRKTMNGYLIWTLVRNYVPFLSKEFTSAFNTFSSEIFGIQQPLERWEMCTNVITQYMGFATEYLIGKRNIINNDTLKMVNDTFVTIKSTINRKVGQIQNGIFLDKYLQSKLTSLRLLVGIPKKANNDDFVKEFYSSLSILKSSFFESVRNGILFQKKIEEKQLSKNPFNEVLLSHLSKATLIKYLPSEHAIIIPRNVLSEPQINPNYSSSIIYGRLGVEIAEAIVSTVIPYGSLWTSDKRILSPYHLTVNESFKNVQQSVKCLERYILNLNLDVSYEVANETALNILRHISAVISAKEAFSSVQYATAHVHQPALESYEDTALFFISYAQMQCSESRSQYQLFENIVHFELPQRTRLHLVWTQVPDFMDSLKCTYNKKLQCPNMFL